MTYGEGSWLRSSFWKAERCEDVSVSTQSLAIAFTLRNSLINQASAKPLLKALLSS